MAKKKKIFFEEKKGKLQSTSGGKNQTFRRIGKNNLSRCIKFQEDAWKVSELALFFFKVKD